MYTISSDSDLYTSATRRLEEVDRYLQLERHEQVGAGAAAAEQQLLDMESADDVEVNAIEEGPLNIDDPESFDGAPVPGKEYVNIPLSPPNAKIISILIKKVAFVRQKNWSLEDHLFR